MHRHPAVPARLGDTVDALAEAVGPHTPVDKTAFDALSERGFCERLEATGRRTVIIAGIEAHICVTQTALSCVGAGYRVHVVADAVCSRRPADRDTALERLRSAGVVVTTSESVLYEALGDARSARVPRGPPAGEGVSPRTVTRSAPLGYTVGRCAHARRGGSRGWPRSSMA